MVQVITVSANTAAYVAETMKTPQRVARTKFVEENQRTVDKSVETDELQSSHIAASVSESTSSALNFLSAGQQPKRSNTLKATLDAYESF